MIWVFLSLLTIPIIWYTLKKPHKYWSDRGVKQTNPWPFLGDSWTTVLRVRSMAEFIKWLYDMYPNERYCGAYQFNVPILMLRDPDLIRQITVKDFDHFTDHRPFVDPDADPLWGQKWREMRATLTGSFTSSKMKTMYVLMSQVAQDFVSHFLSKNEDVIEIDLKEVFTRYTNDVIATTAFGIKVDSLAEPNNIFYSMGEKLTNFKGIKMFIKFFGYLVIPKIFKFLKVSVFDRDISIYFTKIITETIKTREEKGIFRPDIINLLLEARKGVKTEENIAIDTGFATADESPDISKFKQVRDLTNDDICAQALIFFFAGFDNISTALSFGCYELAVNEDVQHILISEIRKTYKEAHGIITYDTLLKMKYMDMVVTEIFRKWPSTIGSDRVCTKDYVIQPVKSNEKPVYIKVGDFVGIPTFGFHRDPNYYPDPDKFDPERFSDENKEYIRPYTYMPFGTGPRNCIGSRFALLETKVLLFYLLLHFKIEPIEKSQIPLILDRSALTLKAKGGFWFGFKKHGPLV